MALTLLYAASHAHRRPLARPPHPAAACRRTRIGPRGVLGFIMTLGLLGAAFTEYIGIHAIFGSFLVGVAARRVDASAANAPA